MKYSIILLLLYSANSFSQDTLTQKDIKHASKLIDISYTDKEIEMMYPDLKDNLGEYKKLHQITLNNSVGMSLIQVISPLPTTKQRELKWVFNKSIKRPNNINDIAFYSINQLGSLLRNKSITSIEITKFFIQRLKKFDDSLHCVVSLTEELAIQQAKQADELFSKGIDKGPLQGIPYGLKDLFSVKGTKTTWGAEPYKNQSIEEDAFVYTKLKESGAVLVAKFTLGALAMGDYWFGGKTRNPWNLEEGSSGSSAGSTSATVAGLIPFSIGTETHGSIISPSHTCGATGLRPTFGSVSRSGAMALSWSLDKIGPICRSAEDAATVFAFIHGTNGKDGSAVNEAFNYTPSKDVKQLRIGYAKNYFDKLDSSSQEWNVLKQLKKLGIKLEEMNFPDAEAYQYDMIGIVIGSEAAAAFDEFTRTDLDDQMTKQERYDWPNYFRTARTIPAVEYINTNRHRALLMKNINDAMNKFDIIITPTFEGKQLSITNSTGHPALCMPIGLDKQQLPNSITFLANLYQEEDLLLFGKFFQDHTDYDEMHPSRFQ